ncbi:MFS transporter, partial [Chloroflexota bacterium]
MIRQIKSLKQKLFYGYVVVVIASLANLVLGGTHYTFSVFFEPLASEFGWTRAVTSGAFSLYMILHGFLFIVTGKLNDRLGPRIVLSGCGIIMGIGYMLMSTTNSLWQIYLFFGIIIAIGMSGGYVPMISTVTRWFENNKKRGLMIGISIAGVGVGTMIMPPIANLLITNFGWRTSYMIMGIMVFVLILAAAQFMKQAPAQPAQSADKVNEKKESVPAIQFGGLSLNESVRTRQFWLLSMAYFSFGLVLQAIIVHIVLHALDLGISGTTAANIFLAVGSMSLTARIVMGGASDKIGNKTVIIISFIIMAAATTWLLFARETWALFVFAFPFGFAYGGLVSAQS